MSWPTRQNTSFLGFKPSLIHYKLILGCFHRSLYGSGEFYSTQERLQSRAKLERWRNDCFYSAGMHSIDQKWRFKINAELSIQFWKRKCITVSTKIFSSMTVFNIDYDQKWAAYYYDFWRSCDSEYWRNDAENSAAHHRNKLQFNNILTEKIAILIVNISHFLLYFWSNKCSHGETWKNYKYSFFPFQE